jgi:FtsH-binding integral membrane protein
LHLLGAVIAFIVIEYFLLQLDITYEIVGAMLGGAGRASWLLVLAAFMGVSYVANRWAVSATSPGVQYLGLGTYVVAEAILFLPLLLVAALQDPVIIPTAGIVTACVFTGMSSVVFFTRRNFAFLGPFLGAVGLGAMALIACSLLFGFTLGIVFTGAMILFASGYILYTTSRVIHDFDTDQHVAAALALFASVALLFWYILQLLSAVSRR